MPLPRIAIVGAVLAAGALVSACGGGSSHSPAATPTPTAKTGPTALPLSGGTTTLRLDATARRVLSLAGVHISTTGAHAPGLSLPISGGRLRFAPLRGAIRHGGALRLSADGRSVEATNVVVDPMKRVLSAEVAGRRVPLLTLDFGVPRTPPPAGGPVILPAKASLAGGSAVAIFGDRLGVKALRAGLPVGSLLVTARHSSGG